MTVNISGLVPVQSVAPRYLNDDLTRGLLFASDKQTIFLILDDGADKWAVTISHPEFRTWRLETGARHWEGMFIPEVELLIEPRNFDLEARREPRAGDIVAAEGQIKVLCKPASAMWPQALVWAKSDINPAVEHPPMFFSRWRVALKKPTGEYHILAEHGFKTD
jgi:hypothetical protein